MDIKKFWNAVLKQDANAIKQYFEPTAHINWHCTNEHFTVDEFIQANCEYPNSWGGTVERIEHIGNLLITVTKVFAVENTEQSFHAVSFIQIENDKIVSIDEYWADDGIAPLWRQQMNIGKPIRKK